MSTTATGSTHCTLYRRSAGFGALALAELEALHGGESPEPGVYLTDHPVAWAETAFGTIGGRLLAAATTLEGLSAQLVALDLRPASFGITAYRIPVKAKGSIVAKTVVADAINCAVIDPVAPELPLGLLLSPQGFRVFVREGGGDGSWQRARQRPHNLPVSIGVPIAKALLNLTLRGEPAPVTLYDPFSGSGTIPLVAALAGHRAKGSDIGWKVVGLARKNAEALGVTAEFSQQDARTSTQRADCIISNPPYGMFCHLPEDGIQDVLANLRGLTRRVTLVTSEDLREPLLAAGYTIDATIIVEPERFKRFVFVTQS